MKSMWTSKTVYTGIITGVVAVCKAVGEATGIWDVPDGAVEALLGLCAVFLRAGITKVENK
jgi:ammonia channel protein AmtB